MTQRIRVLLVDDDPAPLMVLGYVMEDHYDVRMVRTGAEALSALDNQPFDVLICDQRMPGMSGAELCKKAAVAHPEVPQIMITAFANFQELRDAVAGGKLVACLQKPLRGPELLDAVERAHSTNPLRKRRSSWPPCADLDEAEVEAENALEAAKEQLRASRRAFAGGLASLVGAATTAANFIKS